MSQSTLAVIVIAVIALLIVIGLIAAMRGRRATRLRPLPEESRDRYARSWQAVEARFIDDPRAAVGEADKVVVMMLSERGATLQGEKAAPEDLRLAREAARKGDTESMRRGMLQYRRMVDDAVGASRMKGPDHRPEVAS